MVKLTLAPDARIEFADSHTVSIWDGEEEIASIWIECDDPVHLSIKAHPKGCESSNNDYTINMRYEPAGPEAVKSFQHLPVAARCVELLFIPKTLPRP